MVTRTGHSLWWLVATVALKATTGLYRHDGAPSQSAPATPSDLTGVGKKPPPDCGNSWEACDCRNRTWDQVHVLSWHIHYTTNSSDMHRFYDAFVDAFSHLFCAVADHTCPFGPNYGLTYDYVCSLEEPYTLEEQHAIYGGSPWGNNPQRAFYVPIEHIDALWSWAQAHRGGSDVLKHPNTGCMHDDHGVRAQWVVSESRTYSTHPIIQTLEFPCNMPGTGCNDSHWRGPPSCGCSAQLPLKDDAPWDSCGNCRLKY